MGHLLKCVHACKLRGVHSVKFTVDRRRSPFEHHRKDIDIDQSVLRDRTHEFHEFNTLEHRMIPFPFHESAVDEEIHGHARMDLRTD